MGPDFLCIGAQKAATTWLYEVLSCHPGIWMPPVKELHYFNSAGLDSVVSPYWQRRRIRQLQAACRRAMKGTKGKHVDQGRLRWFADYALSTPADDAWYLSLFRQQAGQIAGDITPAYSTLDDRQVDRVQAVCPAARIIFIMRDPAERAISGAKERLGNKEKRIRKISDEDFIRMLDSEDNLARTDYRQTIERWEKRYPADRILYLFFDDLKKDPKKFLERVLEFLGRDTKLADACLAGVGNSNVGPRVEIAPEVTRHAVRKYQPLNVWLHQRFGGVASQWLERSRLPA